MAGEAVERVRLRIIYRGSGPVRWSGGPGEFGVQDKANMLFPGEIGPEGTVTFDVSLEMKPRGAGAPVFAGPFAHGSPDARFLYLSWRNATGEYAQRFKLPLGGISWEAVRAARDLDAPLVGEVIDLAPKITTTGANIGGTRQVEWKPGAAPPPA